MERRPRASFTSTSLWVAAALGAVAMYVLDPQSGRRRVVLTRDRGRRVLREARDAMGTGWRDLRNRMSGLAAGLRQQLRHETPSDHTLEMRVRAELGRWVTHPHAVRVKVFDARVVLGGCVLAAERAQLQRAVEGVHGVRDVELRLAVVDTPDGIPAPRGGLSGPRPPWPIGETHAPATRLLGTTAGVALLACGVARGGASGLLWSTVGLAVAADAARTARRTRRGAAAAPPSSEATVPRGVAESVVGPR